MKKSGEKSQYFTAVNSLHHQPPLQISKGLQITDLDTPTPKLDSLVRIRVCLSQFQ
jgi:hypothetical protein